MTEDEINERNGKRLLTAIYRLSKGNTAVVVTEVEMAAEIHREALFDLTDEQFVAYGRRVWAEVQAARTAEKESEEKR